VVPVRKLRLRPVLGAWCNAANGDSAQEVRSSLTTQKFAEPMLSKIAWAYYASAGDDEISAVSLASIVTADVPLAKVANADAYQKVQFRPRILRKVAEADATTEILGKPSRIPVFISPA
jgi:L-lactate dehydrogenase (cytochrome)